MEPLRMKPDILRIYKKEERHDSRFFQAISYPVCREGGAHITMTIKPGGKKDLIWDNTREYLLPTSLPSGIWFLQPAYHHPPT